MLVTPKYHVTYCTNIHGGSDWKETFAHLNTYVPQIKAAVSPNQPFGLGLRLSNKASEELGDSHQLSNFKNWLDTNGIYVFTMNGFPYGTFHNEMIKDDVHTPDWTTKERLEYTLRLFDQLAYVLPQECASGGISTSPISYKNWYTSEVAVEKAFRSATEHLVEIAVHLHALESKTGKYLHLDIEPEPSGFLENSDDVLLFFDQYLIPIGVPVLEKRLHVSPSQAENLLKRHLTVCYDICHFSLAYEEPAYTFEKLRLAGISVGKIQVSSALKVQSQSDNEEIWQLLSLFDEPTYLHQVTEKTENYVHTYSDLPEVLSQRKDFTELRAHFHVPIFLERFGKLQSTQDQILNVLDYLKTHSVTDHLEVETYTWDVLPNALQIELSASIIRELNWLTAKL